MKIKENADKVFVAPSEDGKWVNWYSDLFLEEKLFPKLFPYGIRSEERRVGKEC